MIGQFIRLFQQISENGSACVSAIVADQAGCADHIGTGAAFDHITNSTEYDPKFDELPF